MVSAHGVAITAVFSVAMLLHGVNHADARYAFPFMFLSTLPVGLIVYSFLRFKGPKVVHFFQILNLLCLVYTFFMGGMAITGDWI